MYSGEREKPNTLELFGHSIWIGDIYSGLQDKFEDLLILSRFMGYKINHTRHVSTMGESHYIKFESVGKAMEFTFVTNGSRVWRVEAYSIDLPFVPGGRRRIANYNWMDDRNNPEKVYDQFDKAMKEL